MSYKDLFSSAETAAAYNTFRPSYPKKVFTRILAFLEEKCPPPHHQAVDVGCGTGLCTRALAEFFPSVLGVDISQAQIDQARTSNDKNNVTYTVSSFDSIPAEDGSTDLVTAAMCFHYFDPREAFYQEAYRILKPHGVLAVIACEQPKLYYGGNDDKLTDIYWQFRLDPKLAEVKADGHRILESAYKGVTLPYTDFVRDENFEIRQEMPLLQFRGFMSSLGLYAAYIKKFPNREDILTPYIERMRILAGPSIDIKDIHITVVWKVFVLMGRK